MFMFIFIICIALIVFTGLFLMRSNLDFIEDKKMKLILVMVSTVFIGYFLLDLFYKSVAI